MSARTLFLIGVLLSVTVASVPTPVIASQQPIDTNLAEQYFRQAEAICSQDNARLWGIKLCGAMLLADQASRMIVANQPDAEGRLSKSGNVYVGRLPDNENIANTAMTWAGVKWTMIMWPLPSNERARAALMFHELFHRVQNDLGLPASNPSNNHLESLEGRLWLQLEWRALAAALAGKGEESRKAIEDALIFRVYRRSLFPDSNVSERALEMHEGLCEYTGVKLRGTPDDESAAYIVKQLESAEKTPTFARSFAYASGPAYGFVLDRTKIEWRKALRSTDDFGELVQKAYSISLPANIKREAESRSLKYSGTTLRAFETERDANRRKRLAGYRAKFIDGPTLTLKTGEKMSYSFDPNNVEPLDDTGTVYPTLRVTDAWGILEVTGGCLMIRGQGGLRVRVPAPRQPTGRKIQGDGWSLELNDGWLIVPLERIGDYTVTRSR